MADAKISDEALRAEVRGWLRSHWKGPMAEGAETRAWLAKVVAARWAAESAAGRAVGESDCRRARAWVRWASGAAGEGHGVAAGRDAARAR